MRILGHIPLTLLCGAILAGCSSLPDGAANRNVPARVAPAPDLALEQENLRILSTYGGRYTNPTLQDLLDITLTRLREASDRPDIAYRITILNSSTINAFSLPDGQLFVTRGLLALANDTDEIASVLAHEMAHVSARHAHAREDETRRAVLVTQVISDLFEDPDQAQLSQAKSQMQLAGFSRAQELEADVTGIALAHKAGFDVSGSPRFLKSLGRYQTFIQNGRTGGASTAGLSTHPSTPERLDNALRTARQYRLSDPATRNRNAYLSALSGMAFGADPADGRIRGNRFIHAQRRISFSAPEGFVLEQAPQAVIGALRGGGQALRFDTVQGVPDQPLSQYMTSGWASNVDAASVQSLTIGGFPAATATGTGQDWTFRLYALRGRDEIYRFIFAAKEMRPETEAAFRASAESFRRLSAQERASIHPLRLESVTVREQDTLESLAQRMDVSDKAQELFQILNGLSEENPLRPGMRVKLIRG